MNQRDIDITVFGATGFTGRQAAERLATHADAQGLRIGLAGRRSEALEALAESLGDRAKLCEIIVADAKDRAALGRLATRSQVVLTTVGPYALYGDDLVDACVAAGTHYVDLTGETPWMRRVIDRHHDKATADGTRIIPACGFDSVPSDLVVLLAARELRGRAGTGLANAKALFSARGGLNGGTLASMLALFDSGDARAAADPLLLCPDRRPGNVGLHPTPDRQEARFDRDFGQWTVPFFMGPVNTRVVRRSHALGCVEGAPYGRDFRYQEAMSIGRRAGRLKAELVSRGGRAFEHFLRYGATRGLLRRLGPKPGQGPSEQVMNEGSFSCRLHATGESGAELEVCLGDRGDPGNRATVKMLVECALALRLDTAALAGGPGFGGVLTPASGIGSLLGPRLKRQGMSLDIKQLWESEAAPA